MSEEAMASGPASLQEEEDLIEVPLLLEGNPTESKWLPDKAQGRPWNNKKGGREKANTSTSIITKEQHGHTISFLHDQFLHGDFKFGSQSKSKGTGSVHLCSNEESYTHEVGGDQTTSSGPVLQ